MAALHAKHSNDDRYFSETVRQVPHAVEGESLVAREFRNLFFAAVTHGVAGPAFECPIAQLPLHVGVSNDDPAPVLRVLPGGGAYRRIEELEEHVVGHRIRLEPP